MITFEALYELPSDKPVMTKVISLGGEQYKQKMMYAAYDDEELSQIPTSVIYSHLENLVNYMKIVSQDMRIITLEEPKPDNGEFIVGIIDFWWARDEARSWWQYARMTREPGDS